MIVDCMTSPVRSPTEPASPTEPVSPTELLLDAVENRAVFMFVGAGLVNAEAVAGLRARRESAEHRIPVREVG